VSRCLETRGSEAEAWRGVANVLGGHFFLSDLKYLSVEGHGARETSVTGSVVWSVGGPAGSRWFSLGDNKSGEGGRTACGAFF